VLRYGVHTDGCGQMRLAGTGAADQHPLLAAWLNWPVASCCTKR
jgi:hypothetical protein